MSDYRVEVSADAQNDIVSIRDYIRGCLKNVTAAERFLTDTDGAISSLEEYPYDHMLREDLRHVGYRPRSNLFPRIAPLRQGRVNPTPQWTTVKL